MRPPLILAALLAAHAAAAGEFTSARGGFHCRFPQGWSVSQDQERDARDRVFGARATTEGNAITVDYYAPDNRLFRSAAEFIRHYRESAAEPLSQTAMGPVRDASAGRLPAKSFEETTKEAINGDSTRPPQDVRTEYVVIPRKNGFFVLSLSADLASFKTKRGLFLRTVQSFTTSVQ